MFLNCLKLFSPPPWDALVYIPIKYGFIIINVLYVLYENIFYDL